MKYILQKENKKKKTKAKSSASIGCTLQGSTEFIKASQYVLSINKGDDKVLK